VVLIKIDASFNVSRGNINPRTDQHLYLGGVNIRLRIEPG
jgi:hypothetical protein